MKICNFAQNSCSGADECRCLRLRTSEHVQSVRTAKFSQLNEAILA